MSSDSAPRYRRRNRWPILVLATVLIVAGIVVWAAVLKPAPAQATGCNEPGPAPTSTAARSTAVTTSPARARSTTASISTTLGSFTSEETLAGVRPADPSQVPMRVLNASSVVGQAKTVTDELRAAGFSQIGQQANDPLYPGANLRCYGEIRYGYAGLAEARTVLVVAPCAQLVLDGRIDNSVDLSLGALFNVAPITKEVQAELAAIKQASAPPPVIEGKTISVRTMPPIPPLPDRTGCPA